MEHKDPCEKVSPVTWKQRRRDCRALSRRLMERGPRKGIHAIIRGGLDMRRIETVRISSDGWQDQGRPSTLKRPMDADEGGAGRPPADTFITGVGQDTWILFPWDSATQFLPPLATGAQPGE